MKIKIGVDVTQKTVMRRNYFRLKMSHKDMLIVYLYCNQLLCDYIESINLHENFCKYATYLQIIIGHEVQTGY